ncbi:MAG: hypothetical protein R3230_04285 [Nitrosopumilaceae archaeon]|nr:hypothetical protein [Nitrosopumilaceae archaeon]
MLNGILLGIVFGVMTITGIAIAYNQFHVETTPEANIFKILTDEQRHQLESGQEVKNLNLEEDQLTEITKTLQHMDEYNIELTEAEKILLDYIIAIKEKEVNQQEINLLKKELADGLLKMGLNLKPEMLESLNDE